MATHVRFMSLTGKFACVREESFETTDEAMAAVRAHCEPHGYSNVRLVDDESDDFEMRVTARTPGGRGGEMWLF